MSGGSGLRIRHKPREQQFILHRVHWGNAEAIAHLAEFAAESPALTENALSARPADVIMYSGVSISRNRAF